MAALKEIEYDYETAKKKNNRIKMTTLSKLITEIKVLSAKKGFSDPPQQLIDAVVIQQVRRTKSSILACPVSKSKTLKNYYKELSYLTIYMPPIITNKEAIKQGILKIADKYNMLITPENKQELMYKITNVLGERVDMRIAAVALEELLDETE